MRLSMVKSCNSMCPVSMPQEQVQIYMTIYARLLLQMPSKGSYSVICLPTMQHVPSFVCMSATFLELNGIQNAHTHFQNID